MAKFPYGGFEFDSASKNDDPWTRLATIGEHLQDGEKIPPFLARWLGDAILRCNNDSDQLMRNLDLRKPRGGQSSDKDAWLTWGERVCRLEDDGCKPEEAIDLVLQEIVNQNPGGEMSRSNLQTLRNKYRKEKRKSNELGNAEGPYDTTASE
jgi:hypothetical protein